MVRKIWSEKADERWNLVPRIIWICCVRWWCSFFSFCFFFFLDWKYLFWVNFIRKIKIIYLKSNLLHRLSRIRSVWWWCSDFLFWVRNTFFWVNLVQKIKIVGLRQNRYFDLNLMVMIIFFCFKLKIALLDKFYWLKIKNRWLLFYAEALYLDQFEHAEFNVDIHILFYTWNTLLSNFSPKIQIVGLSWNLVLILIWLIQYEVYSFLFWTINILFGKIDLKFSKLLKVFL